MMETCELPLGSVFTRKDARTINEAVVSGLVNSIREVGIINPLRVRPVRRMVEGIESDAYEVTAGAHRLKAARKVGLETVPCVIVEDDDLRAELAMIDENLMRAELKGIERDDAFARRKKIYEELHKNTRHGGDRRSDQVATVATCSEPRFTKATSETLGIGERTIQESITRAENICEDAKELVRGTALDERKELEKIRKLENTDQVPYIQKRLASIARAEEAEKELREEKRRLSNESRAIELTASENLAEWIAARCDYGEVDSLISMMEAAKMKEVIAGFRRRMA